MKLKYKAVIFILFTFFLTCNQISVYREADVRNLGIIENPAIDEASGLAASKLNQEVLWTHNDSGGKNRIFAISITGKQLGTFYLQGAKNRDWEDIAIGPGPQDKTDYIFIADIGDNRAQYSTKYIYRVKEPLVHSNNPATEVTLNDIERIVFQLPDGARDAEALFVDPLTKDIYVVSKRESRIKVYRLPFPQPVDSLFTAEFITELPVTQITAGDISRDGSKILLKNYDSVYLWERTGNKSLKETFKHKPQELPYHREPQGEAIAWKPDGTGYYTTSEVRNDSPAIIYFYPLNK